MLKQFFKQSKDVVSKTSIHQHLKFSTEAKRVFNFSAGPAGIDSQALESVQNEFMNYNNCGMGMIEMSHRDKNGPVQEMIRECSNTIRKLLHVPSNFHIFFMVCKPITQL